MVNWNLNLLRLFGKWLTWALHSDYQARIGARLEQGISGVYHERQRQHQDVAMLRALNNVLQGEGAFRRRELEEIAVKVKSDLGYEDAKPRWSRLFSTERSFFRDYSANLVRPALASRKKEVQWYDDSESIAELPPMASYGDDLVGILLNSRDPVSKERHWVAMRMVKGSWYCLDSLLLGPRSLNGEADLQQQMTSAVRNSGSVVVVLNVRSDIS